MSELPGSQESRPRGLGAAGRVTALASSVMDLHVRIALQEVSRETLYSGIQEGLNWERWLHPSMSFRVDVTGTAPGLNHSHY